MKEGDSGGFKAEITLLRKWVPECVLCHFLEFGRDLNSQSCLTKLPPH